MVWDTLGKVIFFPMLKMLVPSLKDFWYSLPQNLMIISIVKRNEWDSRTALQSLMSLPFAKIVVVVDDDIDVNNIDEVKWALAGRFQPDKDIVVASELLGSCIEPSLKDGLISSKLGIDGTKPVNEPKKFEKISIPKDIMEKASKLLEKYLAR